MLFLSRGLTRRDGGRRSEPLLGRGIEEMNAGGNEAQADPLADRGRVVGLADALDAVAADIDVDIGERADGLDEEDLRSASKKFMAGLPMKLATKRLAGRR
jgi:hypothetical protein